MADTPHRHGNAAPCRTVHARYLRRNEVCRLHAHRQYGHRKNLSLQRLARLLPQMVPPRPAGNHRCGRHRRGRNGDEDTQDVWQHTPASKSCTACLLPRGRQQEDDTVHGNRQGAAYRELHPVHEARHNTESRAQHPAELCRRLQDKHSANGCKRPLGSTCQSCRRSFHIGIGARRQLLPGVHERRFRAFRRAERGQGARRNTPSGGRSGARTRQRHHSRRAETGKSRDAVVCREWL